MKKYGLKDYEGTCLTVYDHEDGHVNLRLRTPSGTSGGGEPVWSADILFALHPEAARKVADFLYEAASGAVIEVGES